MTLKTISLLRRIGYPFLCGVLLLLYLKPLRSLYTLSTGSDKYSHLLLIPVLSLFFFFWKWRKLQLPKGLSILPAVIFAGCGGAVFAIARLIDLSRVPLVELDALLLSFLLFFTAGTILFFGTKPVLSHRFSWLLLLLMLPLPSKVVEVIIVFFQHGSAEVVNILLQVTGLSYIRDRLTFHLPSISIFIAKECSGIRSSTALVITGLLAGHLFLRTLWGKSVFMLAVVPLTFIKNGIRITTLTVLAEKIDPAWLTNSTLHHEGGIVFFGIILILFFALLFLIQKIELVKVKKSTTTVPPALRHHQPPPEI